MRVILAAVATDIELDTRRLAMLAGIGRLAMLAGIGRDTARVAPHRLTADG